MSASLFLSALIFAAICLGWGVVVSCSISRLSSVFWAKGRRVAAAYLYFPCSSRVCAFSSIFCGFVCARFLG